jgi:hypothetical protein
MTTGIAFKNLAVERMGEPCQGMPIVRNVGRPERPLSGAPGQALLYLGVPRNINVIVEIYEWVITYGIVESYGSNEKNQTS